MIYDCFTFFNELDLLEIRLNTLSDVVDRFVIAEATRTYSGKHKELVFAGNRQRFAAFADRIDYIVVEDLLDTQTIARDPYNLPWVNENRQRNALMRVVANAKPTDIVMVSDLDEIPRPEEVAKIDTRLNDKVATVRFEMEFFNYYLNFKNYSYDTWRLGTVATRRSLFDESAGALMRVKSDRYTPASENAGSTFNRLRFVNADLNLPHSGWHFSYLGGINAIRKKLESFSHVEFSRLDPELLAQRIANGKDLFGRIGRSFGIVIDEHFPRYIQEHQTELSKLIYVVDENYLRRTARARRMAQLCGCLYTAMVKMVPQSFAPLAVRCRDAVMKLLGKN